VLRDRRLLVTIAVLAVLAGAAVWAWLSPAPETSGPRAAATRARRPAQDANDNLPQAAGVRLAALTSAREEPGASARNPFRFEPRRAGAGGTATSPSESPASPLTLTPAEPTAPSGPPPLAPIELKFIGRVETADGLTLAVLSAGEGRAPLHGKEGDIIDGRYRILKIGTESVEMAYLDGRGRQTIRLTGQ
jgi:hypothetical protein